MRLCKIIFLVAFVLIIFLSLCIDEVNNLIAFKRHEYKITKEAATKLDEYAKDIKKIGIENIDYLKLSSIGCDCELRKNKYLNLMRCKSIMDYFKEKDTIPSEIFQIVDRKLDNTYPKCKNCKSKEREDYTGVHITIMWH